MTTQRVADLKNKLETARSILNDIQAHRERELARLQEELLKSQQFFEGLVAKDIVEIQEIENELKAETEKDRKNWKQWPQAVLIRRWEKGDFDYEQFKDSDNAKLLRQAYKAYAPDAEPRSISRIMRVSAQVAAGWYKTPLDAPHCNPPRQKSDAASPESTPVKVTPAKKTTPAKTIPTQTTPSKTTPAKKTPAEKAPAKKAVKKVSTENVQVDKVQAKKTPATKTPAKRAHETAAVAGEMVEDALNKRVKISMSQ